jgi:protease I
MKPKALIVTADLFEDSELIYPYYRLLEAGYQVDIAAPSAGTVTGKRGYAFAANLSLADVEDSGSCGYKLLVLPGGKAPEALRAMPKALDIARDFAGAGAPIAAICHGPQVLATAGVLRGRKATCYKSVAEELTAAGALYEDSETVIDKNIITTRMPSDLPAFMRAVMAMIG